MSDPRSPSDPDQPGVPPAPPAPSASSYPSSGYGAPGGASPYGAPAGASPYGSPYGAAQGAPSGDKKTLSLISMITGIVGVVAFGWFLPASIAAVILGFMGKKREPGAKGFWLTGIITGFVGIALTILVVGVVILAIVAAASVDTGMNQFTY
ncbi:DUF4190 domain-containing protein [Planctomonas psychrotolerans]|uniref:DUF4190 domain-containing protein n=1 Tax=Planctomonas psychrotolerans TaxID=2528712 RepID=UPI00123BDF60|nr:DUF4190 domain-containing protein [Planctomonas psychrotolerans]